MITITRYNPDMASRWDSFVGVSRTPLLIHLRPYMDYHADRFADHSLLAFRGSRLIAILPACEQGSVLASHPGLTYGGWITPRRHIDAAIMMRIFEASLNYMRACGFSSLRYCPAPWIYSLYPADDDRYALFRFGARITGVLASTALPLDRPPLLSLSTSQAISRARRSGVSITESSDLAAFHAILTDTLMSRHGVAPVHTLSELSLLHSRFPDRIRLLMACDSLCRPIAGSVIYLSPNVAHTQYMAATEAGRALGALPLLVSAAPAALGLPRSGFLDFGSSCENGGSYLNEGLTMQKNGLGGRTVAYSSYTIDL
ncbi:MAG: GNAT family N-acetyltransferase [Paramuribaculum sp.]|nr:GNAT family N-acetyltransferase [Paramuribaculum sp.]